jgi:hypothetical protein
MKPETHGGGVGFPVVSVGTVLAGLFLTTQRCQSQIYTTVGDYTIGDYGGGAWTSGLGVSGFGISNPNTDGTVGQTFNISNVNALITSISIPIYGSALAEFQIGVAAWNGSQPTGPMLYLSSPISGVDGWQTFTLAPGNLILNQNQPYVLMVTPNNFVNTSLSYNTAMGYVSNYSGGQMFNIAGYEMSISDLFVNSWSNANAGFAFSISYQTAPVPEPTVLALFWLGILGMCSTWGRRREWVN